MYFDYLPSILKTPAVEFRPLFFVVLLKTHIFTEDDRFGFRGLSYKQSSFFCVRWQVRDNKYLSGDYDHFSHIFIFRLCACAHEIGILHII